MAATQSSAPTVVLATLCLNEMEWLPSLWAQHKDWPGLAYWVFVEAADEVYATASPGMVGPRGLSVDGTSEYLTELSLANPGKAVYLPLGIVANKGPGRDQNKARARDAYMGCIREEGIAPDLVVVLDADEFYPKRDQALITALGGPDVRNPGGYCLRQRHIWHPPCVQEANHLQLSLKAAEAWPGAMGDPPRSGLFDSEVIGGYWAVPHCRVWRWRPGLRYARNHNWPETREGVPLNQNMARLDKLHLTEEPYHDNSSILGVYDIPDIPMDQMKEEAAELNSNPRYNVNDQQLTEWDLTTNKAERVWLLRSTETLFPKNPDGSNAGSMPGGWEVVER
jgi:hypothetical protein